MLARLLRFTAVEWGNLISETTNVSQLFHSHDQTCLQLTSKLQEGCVGDFLNKYDLNNGLFHHVSASGLVTQQQQLLLQEILHSFLLTCTFDLFLKVQSCFLLSKTPACQRFFFQSLHLDVLRKLQEVQMTCYIIKKYYCEMINYSFNPLYVRKKRKREKPTLNIYSLQNMPNKVMQWDVLYKKHRVTLYI